MCDCFKIGGPFIAEDPDCPEHGTEARDRRDRLYDDKKWLRAEIKDANSIETLRSAMLKLLDLIES